MNNPNENLSSSGKDSNKGQGQGGGNQGGGGNGSGHGGSGNGNGQGNRGNRSGGKFYPRQNQQRDRNFRRPNPQQQNNGERDQLKDQATMGAGGGNRNNNTRNSKSNSNPNNRNDRVDRTDRTDRGDRQNNFRRNNQRFDNRNRGSGESVSANQENNNRNETPRFSHQNRGRLFEEFCLKIENIREKYLVTRKKYFEIYEIKGKEAQRVKLEKEMYLHLQSIRKIEDILQKDYHGMMERKFFLQKPDTIYSSKREMSRLEEIKKIEEDHPNDPDKVKELVALLPDPYPFPVKETFEAVHVSEEQKTRESYKDDREEGIGNMMDYQKYRIMKKKNEA